MIESSGSNQHFCVLFSKPSNHMTIYLQVKNQYVEASNFRQTTTATTENITEVNIPVNPLPQPPTTPFAFQPEGLGQEFDKAYFATLDAFVHDF